MWFTIKCNPLVIHGAKNTFRSIQLQKNLNKDERAVAKKAVQRNAFFSHPDQLLLAMSADGDAEVRAKAVRLIKGIKQQVEMQQEQNTEEPDSDSDGIEVDDELIQYTDDESEDNSDEVEDVPLNESVRKVMVPNLKWREKTFRIMIDCKLELKTEPPYLSTLTDSEFMAI